MASGTSSKTVVVGFRLPTDVYDILQRRVDGKNTHWNSVGQYLQDRIIYDTRREHRKGRSTFDTSVDNEFFDRRLEGKDARQRREKAKKEVQLGQV
jgi:hypothetical protein